MSLPPRATSRATAMASSSAHTSQDFHLWSTTPDINLWPALAARDREANRIGTDSQLARVMSPNDHLVMRPNDEYSGSVDNVAQVYCQDCNTLVSCLYVCTGSESMAIRSVYAWKSYSIIYSALHAFSRPLPSTRLFRMLNAEMHGATVLRSR